MRLLCQLQAERGIFSGMFHSLGLQSSPFRRRDVRGFDSHQQTLFFQLKTTEQNPGPFYLSAGDAPLPTVYGAAAAIYVALTAVWIRMLLNMTAGEKVYRSHWLMGVGVGLVGFDKGLQAVSARFSKSDAQCSLCVVFEFFTLCTTETQ